MRIFAPIKKLSKPIADNVLANILAAALLWVGAGVVSWIAARSSYLNGLPLYQVITVGVVTFLALTVAANVIDLVFVRHQRLARESLKPPTLETHNKPPAAVKAAPNLIALDPKKVLVGEDTTLFECEIDQASIVGAAAVAVIRNQPVLEPIELAEKVRAHLYYSYIGGAQRHAIDNGVWLNTQEIHRDFPVGHTEKLILAFEKFPEGETFTYESNYIKKDGANTYAPLRYKLLGNTYLVTVQLVGGEHGEIKREFHYRLKTRPELEVEKVESKEVYSQPQVGVSGSESLPRDGRLQQIFAADVASINSVVQVCEIECRLGLEHVSEPWIEFSFHIFNNSLCEITIEDKVEGYVTFHGDPIRSPIEMKENQVKDCPTRTVSVFTLRQSLTHSEATSIATAKTNWFFSFSNLRVMIRGGSGFQVVTTRPLDLTRSIRRDTRHWKASFYDIVG